MVYESGENESELKSELLLISLSLGRGDSDINDSMMDGTGLGCDDSGSSVGASVTGISNTFRRL